MRYNKRKTRERDKTMTKIKPATFDELLFSNTPDSLYTTLIGYIYIPDNEYELIPGYYSKNQIVNLLRLQKNNPEFIQFIADMME